MTTHIHTDKSSNMNRHPQTRAEWERREKKAVVHAAKQATWKIQTKSRGTVNQITSIIGDLCHFSLLLHCCFLFQVTMVCHIRYNFRILFHTKCFRVVCHLNITKPNNKNKMKQKISRHNQIKITLKFQFYWHLFQSQFLMMFAFDSAAYLTLFFHHKYMIFFFFCCCYILKTRL